jgi:hypothetical protein
VALPEFVRATGKATTPSRGPLNTISEYVVGLLITAVEKEGALELIMTALQAMKLVLQYGSQDWAAWAVLTAPAPELSSQSINPPTLTRASSDVLSSPVKRPASTDDPPAPTPDKSIGFLNTEQMVAIAESAKVVFRDSIQRRAVLRAEAQVSGGTGAGDEDDAADEVIQWNLDHINEFIYITYAMLNIPFTMHLYIFSNYSCKKAWNSTIMWLN